MTLRLIAITPKRAAIADGREIQREIDRRLRQLGFAGDMIRTMADYPAQMPTKSGYRRSGDLGRGWRMTRAKPGLVEVTNRVGYTVHVEGPRTGPKGKRQTREMRRRRWPNITGAVQRVWRRHRPGIVRVLTGEDARVARSRRRRIT